jgi:hypothetical protein
MKPTSPLSLLLFLQLASTSPIPLSTFFPSKDCIHSSCTPSQQAAFILSISKPHTPPTHLTEPHFPSHQLSTDTSIPAEIIDNTPLSPPKHTPATIALTASRPLVSSYILSLSSPSPTPSEDPEAALPAKPTSALGDLRKEDARQYWESLQSLTEITPSKESVFLKEKPRIIYLCGEVKATTTQSRRYSAREDSDLMVVGIVVLFLIMAVAVEAVERVDYLCVSSPFQLPISFLLITR